MKICGIYKITSPTKKIYVGQSVDILLRWHHYKLGRSSKQPKLHASLIKHGVENHRFEILQECDVNELNVLEKYYVDLFNTFNSKYGLNIKDGGGHKAKRKIIINEEVLCACGCGKLFFKYDRAGRVRSFIIGHNPQNSPIISKIFESISTGPKSLQEIVNKCIGHKSSNVKSILSRLVKEKRVSRIIRGLYSIPGKQSIKRMNEKIFCSCGCGQSIKKFDKHWRERKFISGHNLKLIYGN